MASGRLVIVRESDFTVVGEVSSALLVGTGRLALDNRNGDYVYAAMEQGNFVVIDVSDPTAPSVTGSLSAQAELEGPTAILQNGAILAVASSSDVGITQVSVADPTAPVLGRTLNYASFTNVVDLELLANNYAGALCADTNSVVTGGIGFVADELIDATNFAGLVAGAASSNGLILFTVATTNDTLTAVDVSNPSDISIISTLTDTDFGDATDITVSQDYAYIVTSTGKIVVVNVGDPTAMVEENTYTNVAGLGTPSGIIEQDGILYVIDSAGNLVQLDFTSDELVRYGEYPMMFEGTYNTDSRLHLRLTGPATILAVTYEVDDTDNPPRQA